MQTTGWPPGLLQDDSRELSRWLSTRLGARYQIQRNNMQTNQTPEALAEEIKRHVDSIVAAMGRLATAEAHTATEKHAEAAQVAIDQGHAAINRLRDMAASGAKDAERLTIATDALESIALAGMSGTGQESEEGMRDWHARRAWEFIGNAARALSAIAATKRGGA